MICCTRTRKMLNMSLNLNASNAYKCTLVGPGALFDEKFRRLVVICQNCEQRRV